MKDLGRVVKIEGDRVLLWAGPLGACFGCMAQECGKASREFWALNRAHLPLEAGDWVRIEPLAASAWRQAITSILIPLLGAGSVFALMSSLNPDLSLDLRTLCATGTLFALAILVYGINRLRFSRIAPVIQGVVALGEVPASAACSVGNGE